MKQVAIHIFGVATTSLMISHYYSFK